VDAEEGPVNEQSLSPSSSRSPSQSVGDAVDPELA
jgi:hypothetical protein